MAEIGQKTLDSVNARVKQGLNVNGSPAKPLKPGPQGRRGYPDYKRARGLQPIRDWVWRGLTMRSSKVKSADENRAVLGFVTPEADRIAHVNNLIDRQWGMADTDRQAFRDAVNTVAREEQIVRTEQVS